MRFNNDVVGSEDLIRSAIKSPNFETGERVQGWRIAKDGSATFNNLTIGSDSYIIDSDGNATFNTVSAASMNLGGVDLGTTLTNKPDGSQVIYFLDGNSDVTTGADAAGSIQVCTAGVFVSGNRVIDVTIDGWRIDCGATMPGYVGVAMYAAYDNPSVTRTTGFVIRRYREVRDNTLAYDSFLPRIGREFVLDPNSGDVFYVTVYVESQLAGARLEGGDAAGFGWPTIAFRDLGIPKGFDIITLTGGSSPPPPETTYTKTYYANWSASWDVNQGKMSTDRLYQGDYSGANDRYSKIGFPYSTIQSDLSGSTIQSVQVRLSNEHSWFNSGLTARIGHHNNASEPSGSSSTSGTFNQTQSAFDKGEMKWVSLPTSVGAGFRDNTIKGLTLGRTNAGDQSDYGYFRGADVGTSQKPALRIQYRK